METPPPPPYVPPAPKKKSNTGLIIGLVLGGVALCCVGIFAAVGGLAYFGLKVGGPIIECKVGFETARDAMRQYAAEHGGKLPNAATWQDDVRPYYAVLLPRTKKELGPFKPMPAEGLWGCEGGAHGRTGMAFNQDLSGKPLADVEAANEVVLFEIEKATANASEKYVSTRSEAGSPTMMNEHRGWFVIRMTGDSLLLSSGKEVPINTNNGFGK